jgi:hypothetical protein
MIQPAASEHTMDTKGTKNTEGEQSKREPSWDS